jgi:hypothetical protein
MKENRRDVSQSHVDNLPFDRLVDGELDEPERRRLLAGLDNEPGGWRRCALAFLEAQCWKQAIKIPGGQAFLSAEESLPAHNRQESECLSSLAVRRSPWPSRLGTLAAMAASFLVALWLGTVAQQTRLGGHGFTDQIASTVGNRQPSAQPSQPNVPPDGNGASSPWRVVTVSNGQAPGSSFDLPAVERENVDQQWLQSVPAAIPENVLQALSRTGYQIQQQRELVPVPLQDGRRLMVPVDQVELHYVGNRAY